MTARARIAYLVAVAVALTALLWLVPDHWLSLEFLQSRRADLAGLFAERPVLTAGVYMLLYVAGAVLLIPSAAALNIAAGAIFGLAWGMALTSLSATLGAALAFLTARHLGRDLVRARFGDRLAAFNRGIAREGSLYLFALRLIAIAPYVLINPVMGLTAMRFSTYVWVSGLGMIPVLAVYVNAGTRLGEVESAADLLAPGVLVSFALVGLIPLAARFGMAALGRWRGRRARAQS